LETHGVGVSLASWPRERPLDLGHGFPWGLAMRDGNLELVRVP